MTGQESEGNNFPAETLLGEILARLRSVENVEKDSALAVALRADAQRIAQWKQRGTVPWEVLVEYSRREGISMEWLVNGNGAPRVAELAAAAGAIYTVRTNQDQVYDLAAEIQQVVLETHATLPPEKFALTLRLAHREMIEHHLDQLPRAKLQSLVELAN